MENGQKPTISQETTGAKNALRGKSTRRDVLKLWTLVSVGLPVVLTLAPTEAKAQESEES